MTSQFVKTARRYLDIFLLNINQTKKGEIVDDFHKLYYDSGLLNKTWRDSRFLGYLIQKCPFDTFVYQEIIHLLKPDLIIETGTAYGGSALFMATICDAINHGKILTIDIEKLEEPPTHPRIKYIIGSSVAIEVLDKVKEEIKKLNAKTILVILDSEHSKDHVLQELFAYNQFVTPQSYMIVEDSNIHGHPINETHGPGPMEAMNEFMQSNHEFESDKSMEKHFLTFNPNGYLKKK